MTEKVATSKLPKPVTICPLLGLIWTQEGISDSFNIAVFKGYKIQTKTELIEFTYDDKSNIGSWTNDWKVDLGIDEENYSLAVNIVQSKLFYQLQYVLTTYTVEYQLAPGMGPKCSVLYALFINRLMMLIEGSHQNWKIECILT